MAEFNPHRVQWTPELMERFWSFYSDERRREKAPWFSKLYGDSIVAFAKKHMSVERGMLDYGCGLGHLMEKMLEHNIEVEGLEFSREEAESVRKHLDGRKGFKGVTDVNTLPSSLEDNHAENIICVEVVEHLLDDMLEGSVREMFRLVKPGGRVMITTPHNEDLEASEIMCAECGSIFHQVQHVRSWTPESLAQV
ncbi:MAG: class I SAM-dependent methyltransferase, partial [Candidatus Andersenbacteria bacterium]|nr:class I SAM-dependent methyltransferase [Candidatus Andersenbacteria bacterium]